MSTCASCGATARATATFCHVCGRRLDLLPSSERGDDAPPASRRSGAELLGLALGSYSVLLVANLGLLLGHIGLASLRWIECTMLVAAIAAMQLASGRGAVPSLKAFLTAPKLRPRLLGVIVAAVAAALAAAWLLSLVLPLEDGKLMELYRAEDEPLRMAVIDLCLVAPVLEETVFRGIVLGTFVPLFGTPAAIWSSSLMFATLHLTPLTFVHHTLLGYACARARLESGSMLVPVCIHGLYNALVVLVSW